MPKENSNPINKYVGSRIRMRRMMLNKSQEWLGDQLNITFQQIQKYEKGTNRISASRLQQISNILGVPVAFFFDGAPVVGQQSKQIIVDDVSVSPSIISDFLVTRDGLSLTKNFQKIKSSKLRRHIADLVEQIAEG